MGIYGDNISIPAMPFLFPKLCFHLVFDFFEPSEKLTIKMIFPDNQELLLGGPIAVENMHNNDNTTKYCMLDVIFGNLNIFKEGLYRLVCIFDENKDLKQEIEFNIKIAEPINIK